VIHVYRHPLQASFFRPIHVSKYTRLWECPDEKIVADDGTKIGVKSCTTIREISLPKMTIEQRVEIGIRCALLFNREPSFVAWTDNWISGKDRSAEAAARSAAAAWSAEAAARSAAWAARARMRAEAVAWAASAAEAAAWAEEAAGIKPKAILDIIIQVAGAKESKP
jgi:hypothetical protein